MVYVVSSVLLKKENKLAELIKVVSFALSIPSSNVIVETLFLLNDGSGQKL